MAKRADIRNDLLRLNHLPAVAVPDLQIKGWAGGGGVVVAVIQILR